VRARTLRSTVGCLMFLGMVLTAGVARAEFGLIFVTIEGTRQGKLKGESLRANAADKIEALGVSYEVLSSHDLATGQAAGKRQHKPVTITKEWEGYTIEADVAFADVDQVRVVFENARHHFEIGDSSRKRVGDGFEDERGERL